MVLGDCNKNKWCAFCRNWYDPANQALRPRVSRGMFDVDDKARKKCLVNSFETKALHICPKFVRKF